MKKKSYRILLLFVVFGILGLHFFVPRLITEIKNPLVVFIKGERSVPDFQQYCPNGKAFTFNSFDDTEISAYMTYSDSAKAKGTIILLHGIRGTKEHFIEMSQNLAQAGYNAVAVDSRAHGKSGGTHCTFGVNEKKDISKLIDFLEKEENIHENIGVWGQSLGGAIGLQTMGMDKRIQFGIIESTFSRFNTIVDDYFELATGFRCEPLTDYLTYRAGKIAHFDTNEPNPIDYCQKITQPILVVHGNQDKRINIAYGKENFNHIKSAEKEFIEVNNANHINVWKTGGDEYLLKVKSFLNKQTLPQ